MNDLGDCFGRASLGTGYVKRDRELALVVEDCLALLQLAEMDVTSLPRELQMRSITRCWEMVEDKDVFMRIMLLLQR